MSTSYHYKKGMMQLGPYGLEHMRELVRQAELGRAHQVSTDGGASWQPAFDFPELFQYDRPVAQPESAAADPKPPASPVWHYTVGGAQQDEPVSEAGLGDLIRSGRVAAHDRVWNESFGDAWVHVNDVPALAAYLPQRFDDAVAVGEGRGQGRKAVKRRAYKAAESKSEEPNVFGVSGFICALVAVVLLAIPCLVWLLIAQSFFWIFNIVIPLGILAVLGLTLSVMGLRHPRRGLATAGTVLGVIAVTMAATAIVGSVTIRYRMATLRRVQIDGWAADIELARKDLSEAIAAYRNLRPDADESDEQFAIRETFLLKVAAAKLRDLAEKYDGHLTATASTSEFRVAFEDGVPSLRKAVQDVQQAAEQKGLALIEIMPDVNANTDRLKLLMDTLNLYEKGRLTLPQVEGKMTGR
ncbi:MAG: DUF4339 domain-containing protein [Planctomycetota bacterium]